MADFDGDDDADRMQDLALRGRDGGKGRGKGGRGRGGGGGGGGGQNREVLISKALSRLLRHQANDAGIPLDDEGFAPLDKVMQWPRLRSLNPTLAEIRQTVADNAKQRFTLKPKELGDANEAVAAAEEAEEPARWLIRANQGHSIELASEALHTPITLEAGNVPDVVVHGTYFAFWPSIVSSGGLKRMGRQHVHFGTGVPGGGGGGGGGDDSRGEEQQQQQQHEIADELEDGDGDGKGKGKGEPKQKKNEVISGMRADAEVLVFVDVARSLRDGAGSGLAWWLSANGVVLTEGDAGGLVPARYFREVRGRAQGVGVLWRDGEKVADLPPGVVARVPVGKSGGGGRGRGGRGGGRGQRGGGRGR